MQLIENANSINISKPIVIEACRLLRRCKVGITISQYNYDTDVIHTHCDLNINKIESEMQANVYEEDREIKIEATKQTTKELMKTSIPMK